MTLRRMNVHEFWKPSEVPPEQYYYNLHNYQQYENLPLLSRKLGSGYNYIQDSFSLKKSESSLKRRIARTQSDRRAGPADQQQRFSLTLDRRGRIPEYENLSNYTTQTDNNHHHRSCSDLTYELNKNQAQPIMRPKTISISCHNINQDLEYGPGIVEKLRAKFSRFSGSNQQQQHNHDEVKLPSVNKKFSSFEDLLDDNNSDSNSNRSLVNSQPIDYTRRASRSISDLVGNDNGSDFDKPVLPSKPAVLAKPEVKNEEPEEVRSIMQLRRRFEKHGDQAAKMRFARDPVELITKVNPSYIAPQYKTQPKPASNILKILNDAETTPSEPEFVQIARRLRRFQPEVHESSQKSETVSKVVPPTEPVSSPTKVSITWHRRQPEIPNLTESAKIIRESCDITAVLPPDPHSARVSKQPIPPITPEVSRSTVMIESSPPPEEPKPTVSDQFSQFRKTVVDISSDKSTIANSVFKYENPSQKATFNNSFWKTDDKEKISLVGRKIEDIGPKSIITSPNSQLSNVVSITVKGPSRTNSTLSKYDTTSTNINNTVEEKNEEITKKPPTTYSPSYISLSTKYMEDKKQTTSLNGLLSPREKPYGDDVTILKTDASNTCKTDDAILSPVNTNHLTSTTTTLTSQDDFEDCPSSSSDNDSEDGIVSYDVTPLRPNSLMLTRLANEEELGGDGNVITRSLISLVAEEDLPDFLVALNEKPVRYTFVEETEKPSTSSILKVTLNGPRKGTKTNSSNRIRFDTAAPLAYAYADEITAIRSTQWEDGTIIEYSYFKELEEQELQNDPTMAIIHQWEQQLANSALPDPSFTEALIESTLSSAY